MTYEEYCLHYDGAIRIHDIMQPPCLPFIPASIGDENNSYAVADWFYQRFYDRELIYDPETWTNKVKGFCDPILAHYSNILNAFFKANETILAEYSKTVSTEQHSTATPGDTQSTRYSAPNGNVNYSYTDGAETVSSDPSDLDTETTVTETSTDPDTAEKIARFATELAFIYVRLLDSFEPLFKGVF